MSWRRIFQEHQHDWPVVWQLNLMFHPVQVLVPVTGTLLPMGKFSLWDVGSAGILNQGLLTCISGTGSDAKPGVPWFSRKGQSLCGSTRTRQKIVEYEGSVFRIFFSVCWCFLLLPFFFGRAADLSKFTTARGSSIQGCSECPGRNQSFIPKFLINYQNNWSVTYQLTDNFNN